MMDNKSTKVLRPGGRYPRPCVRAFWPAGSRKALWIPVIGPPHSDGEIIGFNHVHWHVDFRFLRKEQRETMCGQSSSVFSYPITFAAPEVGDGAVRVGVNLLPSPEYPRESYWRVMLRQFRENYPPYPYSPGDGKPSWLPRLEEAHADDTLHGLVCPHRGASLEGMAPDPEGCVTCPLHGLRWNLVSGKLCPITEGLHPGE